jgi:Holliday junction DNA helicase RuvA
MLTRITGTLNRVLDEALRMQVGALEYEVLVPEFVRRQVQDKLGQELTLHTTHYFEGNPMQGRMAPRLVGFVTEAELEFFDLICTVDKVGVRKALKALTRPIRDIADAIQNQDAKLLTTLPGIGPATAEQMVATLRRKVTKFALMKAADYGKPGASVPVPDQVAEEVYRALLQVGHGPGEARALLDKALEKDKPYKTSEELLLAVYQQTHV